MRVVIIIGLEGTPEGVEDNGRCGSVRRGFCVADDLVVNNWQDNWSGLEGTPEGVEDNGRCGSVGGVV